MCAARAPGSAFGNSGKAALAKVGSTRSTSPSRMWRSSLKSGDEAELLKWIKSSGYATLADSGGKHGQPEKRCGSSGSAV
jgi:hypothetical protein